MRSQSPPVHRVEQGVLGFRSWVLKGHALHSMYKTDYRWVVDINEAKCLRSDSHADLIAAHDAPHADCQCGLYAFHNPPDYWGTGEVVHGAILAWGELEVHRDGFRAQFARPIMFAHVTRQETEGLARNRRMRVDALASEMDLPVVERAELWKAARAQGARPVPLSMRPTGLEEHRHRILTVASAIGTACIIAARMRHGR